MKEKMTYEYPDCKYCDHCHEEGGSHNPNYCFAGHFDGLFLYELDPKEFSNCPDFRASMSKVYAHYVFKSINREIFVFDKWRWRAFHVSISCFIIAAACILFAIVEWVSIGSPIIYLLNNDFIWLALMFLFCGYAIRPTQKFMHIKKRTPVKYYK